AGHHVLEYIRRALRWQRAAARRAALFWLRLGRAALYRRLLTCHIPPASSVPPITNRRYGRLKIRATVKRYQARRLPYIFNSASACLRAISDRPPSIRANSVTRSLFSSCRMLVTVRSSFVSLVTT